MPRLGVPGVLILKNTDRPWGVSGPVVAVRSRAPCDNSPQTETNQAAALPTPANQVLYTRTGEAAESPPRTTPQGHVPTPLSRPPGFLHTRACPSHFLPFRRLLDQAAPGHAPPAAHSWCRPLRSSQSPWASGAAAGRQRPGRPCAPRAADEARERWTRSALASRLAPAIDAPVPRAVSAPHCWPPRSSATVVPTWISSLAV